MTTRSIVSRAADVILAGPPADSAARQALGLRIARNLKGSAEGSKPYAVNLRASFFSGQ